ncbi:MAG: energy-coupling factor ABC transporter ATP-binding protein [Trichococcus flocculiformis]|jgi:energy-coupling factor transport system ATP-binding protein|uniref:Energy-coupling factor ABC transporter ATP-binding protein n=2 Tax=root TaxID=1 RepID=A0A847D542_9LACT|nr:energy-coupling factor ABC transporter ATP-binding protein [Trichococcus flocculiformis]MBP6246439.1 energy-coupling factor ABC transporter ATP-binding protein [Trichococcus sp.]MBP7127939.1 energy-coupling factor ABC transporter ATP-binding protein [Trichococcus sp.]MBP8682368.1 energy-coupling factor ABC transporter ATP-binding protein [Trichococcus sp.]MBP9593575.1 energy-coupling factor ABC transporter ATP-binding protein [Trichococcus sp.]MBP9976182.1 energy-coupling factor ABC transpo
MNEIIELRNVTFSYSEEDARPALNNVSLTIQQGEWIAIIGPNGSGKSTLAKTINGLIEANSGEVIIEGVALNAETVWDVRKKIGMVFQNPDNQFVGSTVQDDVAFGLENVGIPREEMVKRVADAVAAVNMANFMDKEPARLSGGQKQRVAIAGIVALSPDIIILDEATTMLDPEGRHEVIETIQEIKEKENLTVISITHDIDEAAKANRIFVMEAGQLTRIGTPEEIFSLGKEIIDIGLDIPFPEKLKYQLKRQGLEVPENYLTEEGMVNWLWTLLSKK